MLQPCAGKASSGGMLGVRTHVDQNCACVCEAAMQISTYSLKRFRSAAQCAVSASAKTCNLPSTSLI